MRPVSLALLLVPQVARAATLTAPGAYGSIQAAIDASAPGDTIAIDGGSFDEALVVPHDLVLQGHASVRTVVELGAATALGREAAIHVSPGAVVTVERLDVRAGGTRGIYAEAGSNLTLLDVVLADSGTAGDGGGAWVDGDLVASDLVVSNTTASGEGGGLWVSGDLSCTNCRFVRTNGGVGGAIFHGTGTLGLTDVEFVATTGGAAGGVLTEASWTDVVRNRSCGVYTTLVALGGSGSIRASGIRGPADGMGVGMQIIVYPGASWTIEHTTIADTVAALSLVDIRHFTYETTGDTGRFSLVDTAQPPGGVVVRNSLFANNTTTMLPLYGDPLGLIPSLSHNLYTTPLHPSIDPGPGSVVDGPVSFVDDPDLLADRCPIEAFLPTFEAPSIDAGDGLDPDGSPADIGASGGPDTWAAFHLDDDADGYSVAQECNDASAASYPGAEELCDGVDNDCNGIVDLDSPVLPTWFPDADGDGHGDGSLPVGAGLTQCDAPEPVDDGTGTLVPWAPDGGDCDDTDPTISPSATEDCDPATDLDCDGSVDFGASDATAWWPDLDGDGYGDATAAALYACATPPGLFTATGNGDCDDTDASIRPDAAETCDGIDQNCSGDESDASDVVSWYPDTDGDGYPSPAGARFACVTPAADYVPAPADDRFDCDDTDPLASPAGYEVCDGIDNDCSGTADDLSTVPPTWYADDDGDGYGSNDPRAAVSTDCPGDGYVDAGTDCDDTDPGVFPGAPEPCNGRDDDCSGVADDGPERILYIDGDGDGWGGEEVSTSCPRAGLVEQGGDCQDAYADVNPGAEEIPGNDVDEDCVDGPANPASTPRGEPAVSGCACSSGSTGGAAAWLGLLPLVLAGLRRRPWLAVVGLAACAPEAAPDRLPEVQLTFGDLAEATARAPFFGIKGDEGIALLQRDSRVTVRPDGRLALHHRGRTPVEATFALEAWGRSELLPVPTPAPPEASGPRVVLERGPLVEWYLNGDDGLEQGFTLRERPGGTGPLRLAMALDGLSVVPHDDGLLLVDDGGVARFRYDKLFVTDRHDRPVPASLDADCEAATRCRIELVVDDRDATWPLYVDPLLAEFVTDVNAVDAIANLGFAVDVDGDRAVIGAPSGTDGRVFVLERNVGNPDAWGIEETLRDSAEGFGSVVSFDDPYLAVGAPDAGEVLLYGRDGSWSATPQRLTGAISFGAALDLQLPYLIIGAPEDGDGSLHLAVLRDDGTFQLLPLPLSVGTDAGVGASVALQLPYLLVGAPGYDGGRGAVLLLDGLGNELQRIVGPTPGAAFGTALAVSSARLAIGNLADKQVHTYERDPLDGRSYVPTAVPILPQPTTSGGTFGVSMDLLNDSLVIGDSGTTAYVHHYALDASGWIHTQSTEVASDNAGGPVNVALNSRTIVAGVPMAGTKGRAAVFTRSSDTIVVDATLETADASLYNLGRAVAVDGDLAAVGDPTANSTFGGLVHLFARDASGWSLDTTLVPRTFLGNGEFGHGVDIDGDIVVAGAPGAGQAFVYTRSGVAWNEELLLDPDDPGTTRFGEAVAIDGFLVAIGDPSGRGRVQVYEIDASLQVGAVSDTITTDSDGYGVDATVQLGTSVDIEGQRIVIGAPGWDAAGGVTDAGAVEVYDFEIGGVGAQFLQRIEGVDPDDRCGWSVAVDADRIAIGCPNNGAALLPGKAMLYRGDNGGYTQEFVATTTDQDHDFGYSVAIDTDRWLVSAKGISRARMYQRNTDGEDQWGEELVFDGPNSSAFGYAMDLDGNTVIIGSPNDGTYGTARIFTLDATIPPTLFDDTFSVLEDAMDVPLDIVKNDLSGNATPLVASNAITTNGPDAGSLTKVDDELRFTPDPDVNGPQTFQYTFPNAPRYATVTINVIAVNDIPVAVDDAYVATEEVLLNAPSVLANDSDVESTELTANLVSGPSQAATFALAPDGTFTYEGVVDFYGTDTFTYEAIDGDGAASPPATVVITVLDTPEAPVLTDSLWTTERDTRLVVPAPGLADSALAQLPGPDTVFGVANASGLQGDLRVFAHGGFNFVPSPGFVGSTSFVVEADNDGAVGTAVVTIEVVDSNQPPEPQPDTFTVAEDGVLEVSLHGVLANDIDPDGDVLLALFDTPSTGTFVGGSDGTFTFTPPADFHGQATVTYRATDGVAVSDPVLVTFTVTPVNDAPVALPDSYEVEGPGPHVLEAIDGVLVNDSDIDGDGLLALLLRPPPDGEVELDPDGSFVFTPRLGAEGPQTFDYLASDGLATSKATVEITVLDNPQPTDTGDTAPGGTDTGPTCEDLYYPDRDGDGFADATSEPRAACAVPPGFTDQVGDCDDARADRYPGAPEIQGDGVDQDCDGADADIAPVGACRTGPAQGGLAALMLLLLAARRRGVPSC